MSDVDKIRSRVWREVPEADNPFSPAACYCHGYDVYGEVLDKATWSEYIYLLFKGDRPDSSKRLLLEKLAIAIANPGPRDHGVQAAMNGGVGGSGSASSLIAALAVGAGQLGGAREVFHALKIWHECDNDLRAWKSRIGELRKTPVDVWPQMEHPPGFDPYGVTCTTPAKSVLQMFSSIYPHGALGWLEKNRQDLEDVAGCPLAIPGISAAALYDLGFSPHEGEMLYLILRLPGAAVHSIEQAGYGFRNFPFYRDAVVLKEQDG